MHLLRHLNEAYEVEIELKLSLYEAEQLRKVMHEAAALGSLSQHRTAKSLKEFLDHLLDIEIEEKRLLSSFAGEIEV